MCGAGAEVGVGRGRERRGIRTQLWHQFNYLFKI